MPSQITPYIPRAPEPVDAGVPLDQTAMFSLIVAIVLFLVKILAGLYTVATLPLYFVFQKPWNYWWRSRTCFAKPVVENDPSTPYWRLGSKCRQVEALAGVSTLDELARRAICTWPLRRSLGKRTTLGRTEEKQSSGKVFRKLLLGEYEWLTYREVDREIELTARGLQSIGARPYQHLAILAETRVEWLLTAQACFRTNVPLVTLYATLPDEGIASAINETQATHLVTSADLLPRVLSIADKMPSLTHVVYMEDPNSKPLEPTTQGPLQVIPFSNLENLRANFVAQKSAPTPYDVAIVMYTSGSSGVPKGVVATHRNIIAAINGLAAVRQAYCTGQDTYIAYLPLAHILELAVEALVFGTGTSIGFSSPLTLTNTSTGLAKGCPGDVSLLRPTQMAVVPLVLDKICKGISDAVASRGPLLKALFDHAVDYKNFWLDCGFNTPLLNLLLFSKVRRALGSRLKVVVSGSAPLSIRTRRFARACLCCHVIEAYGLTETCAVATVNDIDDTSVGRVGAPIPGCYLRLVDWSEGSYRISDKPNPRGEIVIGGAFVTLGYFKRDELTRESFRHESGVRWFYTGDVGEIFPDGTLRIIDRKKELVKLQHGEYVSLGHVESVLKACPLVDNALAYGSSLHTYLVALVAPNHQKLQHLARELSRATQEATLKELCEDPKVAKAATEAILAFARQSELHKTEVPLKLKLCAEEWTPQTGLVSATFKIRRKPLQNFYERDIKVLYGIAE
ncbi:long-chain-fatty-acid--CoA ligase 4-like [Dermacentor andersoni]|uniref:long-chain-fatty-acid--CoA ligase 4-like n=1 Tax=Dermacentor andersoni TaxID=34620 RepID=UPI00241808E4|nr:long-chain-fatty-acid--CoA ligase 4-like [Dermacentor andersoni]